MAHPNSNSSSQLLLVQLEHFQDLATFYTFFPLLWAAVGFDVGVGDFYCEICDILYTLQ